MKFSLKIVAACAVLLCQYSTFAQAQATAKVAKAPAETSGKLIKVAMIEGLSGPFGPVGQNQLKSYQFVADRLANTDKNPAGVKFEFVPFDSKSSPQEALVQLKAATDQGFRYITQGNGSAVAGALSDAVAKHNERNPGKEVIFLNYAAVDPALTNERCNFWHFRLDADTSMKMEALTSFMKDDLKGKNIYLINQNYSHGHQVVKYFKEGIARKRTDVKIVGEDLHPIGQVKDFSPYIAKIKASGADTVLTGNWGTDMTLLVKAMNDAGMKIALYVYYGGVSGTPTALAQGSDWNVSQIAISHSNFSGDEQALRNEFKKKFNDDYYTFQTYSAVAMLSQGMANAKSIDPVKVAAAMEDMTFKNYNGEVKMRKTDHQLQQPRYVSKWPEATAKDPYSEENTGFNCD